MSRDHLTSLWLSLGLIFFAFGSAASQVTRLEAGKFTVTATFGGIVHVIGGAPQNEAALNFLPTPAQAPPGTQIASSGRSHLLYLAPNGRVWSSGTNRFGQLGTGVLATNPQFPTLDVFPVAPTLLRQAAAGIEAGAGVSYAWDRQGALFGWGTNFGALLGTGTQTAGSPIPLPLPLPAPVVQVDSKASVTVALDSTGGVWHWGQGAVAQTLVNIPTLPVNGLPNVIQVVSGGQQAFAVSGQGTVFTWTLLNPTPVALQGLPPIQSFAADANYALALDVFGVVWMVGQGPVSEGVLSPPPGILAPPRPVTGLPTIFAVGAANASAYAADSQGRLWSWGDDTMTALGLGDPDLKAFRPQTVPFSNQSPGMVSTGISCSVTQRELLTRSTPTLGAEVILSVFTSLQTVLYVAPGGPTSTPWTLGAGCDVWLDPAGLATGIAAGSFPMAPSANALVGNSVVAAPLWIFNIPDDPSLIGQNLTAQALVIAPSEIIPFVTTNALTMSIR